MGERDAALRAAVIGVRLAQLPDLPPLPGWSDDDRARLVLLLTEDTPWLVAELQRTLSACNSYRQQIRFLEQELEAARDG